MLPLVCGINSVHVRRARSQLLIAVRARVVSRFLCPQNHASRLLEMTMGRSSLPPPSHPLSPFSFSRPYFCFFLTSSPSLPSPSPVFFLFFLCPSSSHPSSLFFYSFTNPARGSGERYNLPHRGWRSPAAKQWGRKMT